MLFWCYFDVARLLDVTGVALMSFRCRFHAVPAPF